MRDASAKVEAGFVSFTEVAAGEHRSYNEWHLYDHLPEQLPLRGIAWGQRWVWTPALARLGHAVAPLDRIHYATLYLLAAPVDATIDEFFALAQELHDQNRFHEHRTSHLSGPASLVSTHAAPRALVSAEAIPYRPHTGVHVRVEPTDGSITPVDALFAVPGVAGVWVFAGDERRSSPGTDGLRITWCWLDDELEPTAAALAKVPHASEARFVGTLAPVDPHGAWDWFEGGVGAT